MNRIVEWEQQKIREERKSRLENFDDTIGIRTENIYVAARKKILDYRRDFQLLKCFKYLGMKDTIASFNIINTNHTENL